MEQIIKDSVEYLKTTDDKVWEIFTNKSIVICEDRQAKRYILHMRRELITSINHMKLITFPILKFQQDSYDQTTVTSFSSYFSEEKDCLVKLRRLLSCKNIQDCDLDRVQLTGLLLHTLGNSHSNNMERLLNYVRMENALNEGINVSINEERISPCNQQLVKRIKFGIDKQLNNK